MGQVSRVPFRKGMMPPFVSMDRGAGGRPGPAGRRRRHGVILPAETSQDSFVAKSVPALSHRRGGCLFWNCAHGVVVGLLLETFLRPEAP